VGVAWNIFEWIPLWFRICGIFICQEVSECSRSLLCFFNGRFFLNVLVSIGIDMTLLYPAIMILPPSFFFWLSLYWDGIGSVFMVV